MAIRIQRATSKRKVTRSKPSERKSNFAHSNKEKNRIWLVGFTCHNNRFGCECNIDTPQRVKNEFKRKYGFDYDEYCNYALVQAPDEKRAKLWAWGQQGATEHPHDVWGDVDVIAKVR